MPSLHSIRAGVAALVALSIGAAHGLHALQDATPGSAQFTVYLRGVQVGTEESSVEQTSSGWTIIASGRSGAPGEFSARRLQVRYDSQWRPLDLTLESNNRGEMTQLKSTVSGGMVRNEITTAGKPSEKSDTIDPNALLLPNLLFASYEALSAQLRSAAAGTSIPIYVAPQGSASVSVHSSANERIQTLARVIDARISRVTMTASGAPPVDLEIWGDEAGRLLRISVPAQSLDVMRTDIASVTTRRMPVSRPGDEQVRIPANGFTLAGTVSKPQTPAARMPAVVLVGGSGPTDRDETVFNVPIFGQLSNALADAGFLVVRYDKRGVGQSGGRPESATLEDYAADLRAVVRMTSERRDVDRNRLAVIGHSEGGSVAMIAAKDEDRIRSLILVSTMGVTGVELNLAQVVHALELAKKPEAERQTTIELQKRIQQAVLTGQGWEQISTVLRQQADTPWFRSFLAFDPARIMKDIDQPILIVQGTLDTQVEPANADRLASLARARDRKVPVEVVKATNINHLLLPAHTGEVNEYVTLSDQQVSPLVIDPIVAWLKKPDAMAR